MMDDDIHCGTGAGCSEDSLCFCDCSICSDTPDDKEDDEIMTMT